MRGPAAPIPPGRPADTVSGSDTGEISTGESATGEARVGDGEGRGRAEDPPRRTGRRSDGAESVTRGPRDEEVLREAARRRSFAIISHPDAGKTTLTEKLLLYAGAVQEAGAVRARGARRRATSDWMALERQRGISVSSTVLQLPYRDHALNLLDTPGHRDFSEDTYRVLSAADAAVMVLDVAKGVEPQTLKLFEVCRGRRMPVITFLNKLDRPGRDPLDVVDEIERVIGLRPTPVTWPVGQPGQLRGILDRRSGRVVRYHRAGRGQSVTPEEEVDPAVVATEDPDALAEATEADDLFQAVGANWDRPSFLRGETTPLFVGSALTNVGVRQLLDALVELAPAPRPQPDIAGVPRPLDAPLSGFVFKVQANMDPAHRDRIAFLRVCSGRFERGMTVVHQPSGRPFSTKHASSLFGQERETVEVAYPGDVVGLVNAADLRLGDTLYLDEPVRFPPIPVFAPELFVVARSEDTSRFKQFRRGLAQLEEEGVVQVLRDEETGDAQPILAAVGQMQFEVFAWRLEHEFGARVELRAAPYTHAVETDPATAHALSTHRHARVMRRRDGRLVALFESEWWLERLRRENPAWRLESLADVTDTARSA